MIAISGLFVLVAIGLLVVGLVLSNFVLVYASIGVSLVSAVCWAVGVYLGRDQLRARGGTSKRTAKTGVAGKDGKKSARKRPAAAQKASGQKARRPAVRQGAAAKGGTATAVTLPDDATVAVVPGRLRYHLSTCRQVGGRETEELELAEAREQGYVACTACRPDSVLAARAEQSASDDSEAEESEAEKSAAEPDEAEPDESAVDEAAVDEAETDEAETDEAEPAETAAEEALVATVTGQRRYHLETCQVVQDAREDETEVRDLTVTQARDEGLTPCTVCGPPAP